MREVSCKEVMERVPALIVGDLSPAELAEIDLHTSSCQACAQEIRASRALSQLLDDVAEADGLRSGVGQTPPELRKRIMSVLPREAVYDQLDSPIGRLYVVASEDGLFQVQFGGTDEDVSAWVQARGLRPVHDTGELRPYVSQLRQYFAGERNWFDVPVDLSSATPFARRVLEATARIPFGRLASYRDLANDIGQPGATRAVGNALGSNPVPIVVPCHRVIRSDGSIGGYTGGLAIKWRLLEIEGVSLGMSGR